MDYNSKEFKDLKTRWYSKLKKEGFEDIEVERTGFLKVYSSQKFTTKIHDSDFVRYNTNYYAKARQFLNDHKFKNELEKIIWYHHSEGLGVRVIAERLKKARIENCKKTAVQEILARLRKLLILYAANETDYD